MLFANGVRLMDSLRNRRKYDICLNMSGHSYNTMRAYSVGIYLSTYRLGLILFHSFSDCTYLTQVVDRIRTCMSHKGLLAFQASAPPVERLRHFGVRPRTRTGTSLTRLLEIFKTSALPIRLRRTYWRQIEVSILILIKNHLFSKQG